MVLLSALLVLVPMAPIEPASVVMQLHIYTVGPKGTLVLEGDEAMRRHGDTFFVGSKPQIERTIDRMVQSGTVTLLTSPRVFTLTGIPATVSTSQGTTDATVVLSAVASQGRDTDRSGFSATLSWNHMPGGPSTPNKTFSSTQFLDDQREWLISTRLSGLNVIMSLTVGKAP